MLDRQAHFKEKITFIGRKGNKVFCQFVSLFWFKNTIVNPFHFYKTMIFQNYASKSVYIAFYSLFFNYILYFKYEPHTIPSISTCSVHRALQVDPKT